MSAQQRPLDRTQAATDGNGWKLVDDGVQRRWHKRWLGLAMPAGQSAQVLAAQALPVAVATLAAVDPLLAIGSATGNVWDTNGGFEGPQTATTLAVALGTVDGTLLNAKHATLDLYVTLYERLP